MSYQPIKTKCWIKFLEYKGCKYIRTTASHHQYKCPNCLRTIPVRTVEKDVPAIHLKTTLQTMGVSYQSFAVWKQYNC